MSGSTVPDRESESPSWIAELMDEADRATFIADIRRHAERIACASSDEDGLRCADEFLELVRSYELSLVATRQPGLAAALSHSMISADRRITRRP